MSTFSPKESRQRTPSSTPSLIAPTRSINHQQHPILNLQRTIGNQAALRLMQAPVRSIQRKLAINEPGDAYEQEADRVSEQVMRMPETRTAAAAASSAAPRVQRACACGGTCDDCKKHSEDEHARVQMKAAGPRSSGGMEAPPIVHEALRSPGKPLDRATRDFMEPRFGHDFSGVRVHTGTKAMESAKAVNARAYTAGNNVVFGAGEFTPGTHEGQRLLGHELTHVVQQDGLSTAPQVQRKPSTDDERAHNQAVQQHKEQQLNVAQILERGRKIKRDPSKGPLDPDNLYVNTIDLLDKRRMVLTILTPTHYSDPNNPTYFDPKVHYPDTGGDYLADPRAKGVGTVSPPTPGTAGLTDVLKTQSTSISTVQKGDEKVQPRVTLTPQPEQSPEVEPQRKAPQATPPVLPALTWTAAEVQLFTSSTPISESDFRNTFVHEGQHVADLDYLQTLDFSDWHTVFARYASEFRAFWLQPKNQGSCPIPGVCVGAGGNFPDPIPIDPADKQPPITLGKDQNCKPCPTPAQGSTPPARSRVPQMKNSRQDAIFRTLMSNYSYQQFDCFYVCNKSFSDAVDAFTLPAGENVANSVRLMDLRLELQKLAPTMSLAELKQTKFEAAISALDDIDWAFLKERQTKSAKGLHLSDPLWDLLRSAAPAPIVDMMAAVVDKKSPRDAAVKALESALKKIK
ncbi:MAG: DUF4157 domain-containing protein [Acidobacteriia bacterium]|nr:DUF4157 domain-containing protein [Terriglobia bacterium]